MKPAGLRARIEHGLHRAWRTRGLIAWLLLPLGLVHAALRGLSAAAYRVGVLRKWRIGVPVVVVGNLYVGGTGKTPLTLEIVRALVSRGHKPGVVARGYGADKGDVRIVEANAKPAEVGDEPLLMAQALHSAGIPVVVGRDRVAACRILLSVHPRCDVIVADDGLQHRQLARDAEVVLLDERGLGNGWLLPAGPLRDPPRRLEGVTAVVCNGIVPPVRIFSPRFVLSSEPGNIRSLADPSRSISLAGLVDEQRRGNLHIVAAAGIGAPERFFSMLRDAGLEVDTLPLPDHYDFAENPFLGRQFDLALITEKDAVKCAQISALATDGRMCVVALRTSVDPGLVDLIEAKIAPSAGGPKLQDAKATDGPKAA